MNWPYHAQKPWFWGPTAVQSLAAAVLCFVPLFNLLGYEFALGTGLVAAAILLHRWADLGS